MLITVVISVGTESKSVYTAASLFPAMRVRSGSRVTHESDQLQVFGSTRCLTQFHGRCTGRNAMAGQTCVQINRGPYFHALVVGGFLEPIGHQRIVDHSPEKWVRAGPTLIVRLMLFLLVGW